MNVVFRQRLASSPADPSVTLLASGASCQGAVHRLGRGTTDALPGSISAALPVPGAYLTWRSTLSLQCSHSLPSPCPTTSPHAVVRAVSVRVQGEAIANTHLPLDDSSAPRGYGFVSFTTDAVAERIIRTRNAAPLAAGRVRASTPAQPQAVIAKPEARCALHRCAGHAQRSVLRCGRCMLSLGRAPTYVLRLLLPTP